MEPLSTFYVLATSVVTVCSIIANYTDTLKDDAFVAKVYKIMETFAFLNNKAKK